MIVDLFLVFASIRKKKLKRKSSHFQTTELKYKFQNSQKWKCHLQDCIWCCCLSPLGAPLCLTTHANWYFARKLWPGSVFECRNPCHRSVMRRETFEVVYYCWKQNRTFLFAGAVNSQLHCLHTVCASPLPVTVMLYENNRTFDAVKIYGNIHSTCGN